MERLYIDLGEDSYHITVDEGSLASLAEIIGSSEKIAIITDGNVDYLYGPQIEDLIKETTVYKIIIPPGEASKSLTTVEAILNQLLAYGLTRKSKIIALGGGVVGDIAGFTASIYMRGIDYIQVPTTLLSQVDSSVGGKTGVNMKEGKNTIGSFYQPRSVIIDTEVLKTLPKREVVSGIGEVIKYGIIYDYEFLQYINNHFEKIFALDTEVMKKVIKECCKIKAAIVAQDEKEKGLRKILNFGHTIGHGIEAISNYEKYTHGEAVIIGMHYEAKIAKALGYIGEKYFKEIDNIIKQTEIFTDIRLFSLDDLVKVMMKDKKNAGNRISLILPIGFGEVKEVFLTEEELLNILTWRILY